MDLILVRHGDPDYEMNCLTELGHRQAEAASVCLSSMKPDMIFASTYGRAIETAEHTASKLNMEIRQLHFMREIATLVKTDDEEIRRSVSPWHASEKLYAETSDLLTYDYSDFFPWSGTNLPNCFREISEGFEGLMRELGCFCNGRTYCADQDSDLKIMIFAHAGSISCLLAHILGLHPYYCLGHFRFACTGITRVHFKRYENGVLIPELITLNEHNHLDSLLTDCRSQGTED